MFFLICTASVKSLGFAYFCNFTSISCRMILESFQVENQSTYCLSDMGNGRIKLCMRNASEFLVPLANLSTVAFPVR